MRSFRFSSSGPRQGVASTGTGQTEIGNVHVPRSFRNGGIPGCVPAPHFIQEKSVGRRAFVVAAGPAANFALAAVVFTCLFAALGRPVLLPEVGGLVAGGPAEAAGLAVGDSISSIGGIPVARFEDIQRIVGAAAGRPLALSVIRGGAEMPFSVTPEAREGSGGVPVGLIGIRAGAPRMDRLAFAGAVRAGASETWTVTAKTLEAVGHMFTARGGAKELGGPLRIAEMSGEVAALGAASLLSFVAVLSVNLGLMNLFPVPVLDGGHLVFFLYEAVTGRPLPGRALDYAFRGGLAALALVMVFSTWNDLGHLGVFRRLASLAG